MHKGTGGTRGTEGTGVTGSTWGTGVTGGAGYRDVVPLLHHASCYYTKEESLEIMTN